MHLEVQEREALVRGPRRGGVDKRVKNSAPSIPGEHVDADEVRSWFGNRVAVVVRVARVECHHGDGANPSAPRLLRHPLGDLRALGPSGRALPPELVRTLHLLGVGLEEGEVRQRVTQRLKTKIADLAPLVDSDAPNLESHRASMAERERRARVS